MVLTTLKEHLLYFANTIGGWPILPNFFIEFSAEH